MTEDLDPELKELFDAEEDEAPPAKIRDRLAGALATTLALPVPPPPPAAPLVTAPMAPVVTGMVTAAKAWTMAGAAFVAGGAAVIVWTTARPPAALTPAADAAPTIVSPVPPPRSTSAFIPAPEDVPPTGDAAAELDRDAATSPRPSPSSSESAPSISIERGLLDEARSAVSAHDSATALRILGKHARRFPDGQLWEEREALAIDALVQAHDYDHARRRAGRLRERSPNSLFLPMVDAAVASIP